MKNNEFAKMCGLSNKVLPRSVVSDKNNPISRISEQISNAVDNPLLTIKFGGRKAILFQYEILKGKAISLTEWKFQGYLLREAKQERMIEFGRSLLVTTEYTVYSADAQAEISVQEIFEKFGAVVRETNAETK